MPIGVLTCRHDWIPTIPEALETRRIPGIGWLDNPQHLFTFALIKELPHIAVRAIEDVDDAPIDGLVRVDVVPGHPWVQNASTFCFELQPGNGGLTDAAAQKRRRIQIARQLWLQIAVFVEGYPESIGSTAPFGPESFDIEVLPLSRSGCTLRYDVMWNYKPKKTWGGLSKED